MDSIKKFTEFMKRYNKSNYISGNSLHLLNEIGLGYKKFTELDSTITNCVDLFNKNDFELLGEILYDVSDDYPLSINPSIHFYLKVESEEIDKFLVGNIHNKYKTFSDIISHININKKRKIESLTNRIQEYSIQRPGAKDFFSIYSLTKLNKSNYYEKIKITPIIDICFECSNVDINEVEIKSLVNDYCIKRYFLALGINTNYKTEVNNMRSLYDFKISIDF